MIVVDVNLLVYAHNESAPLHAASRAWWASLLARGATVGLPWATMLGFVRLVTHPRVLESPLPPLDALARVERWLARPGVRVLEPGPRHVAILRTLFEATGVAGALTTAAHLAAIAIEHQPALCSNDADFARFPGLRWRNPVA